MPEDLLLTNIKQTTGKEKRTRVTTPEGIGFCQPSRKYTVIYCGTRSNIQSRLLEHLFNDGNEGTGKLGCELETDPFNSYGWFISYYELSNTTLRYALSHGGVLRLVGQSFV
jgi:hypothetical protein